MYTYVLYCPDIAMCPWVLEMLSKNSSKNNFDSVVFPQSIECLVLLHSPFIIDMKELAKQDDEGHDGKRDYNNVSRGDETKMKKYCSSFVFVTGCMYTKRGGIFYWLHSYNVLGQYKNFRDLLACLITIALEEFKATSIVDCTTTHQLMEYFTARWSLTSLVNECPEDIVKLSIALNGENNKISLLSLSTEEVNVKMETVKNILQMHYTDELKSAKKSVRRIINSEPRVKLEIYKNPAIIDCKIDAQEEEQEEWITEVVDYFCKDHALLEKFVRNAEASNWEDAV